MKKWMLILLVALPPGAQQTTAAKAATDALAQLAVIVRQAPGTLNLTADEAARARVLAPLAVAFVGLEALRNYTPGTDPRSLVRDTGGRLFPIAVDADVRAEVTVAPDARGVWKMTEVGRGNLAKTVAAARASLPNASALVIVPALNAFFLASDDGETLRLTPLYDVQGTQLGAGRTDDARAVLSALKPRAQAHNGEPT